MICSAFSRPISFWLGIGLQIDLLLKTGGTSVRHSAKPREWFLVPLHAIDEMVKHIQDEMITDACPNSCA